MDDGLNSQAYLQFPSKYINNQLLLTSTTDYFNIGRKLNNINPIKDELESGEGKLSQDSISNYVGIESNFNNSDHLKKEIEHDKANVFGFKVAGWYNILYNVFLHHIKLEAHIFHKNLKDNIFFTFAI